MDVDTARDTIAAEPPPRLRLAALLYELGAREGEADVREGEVATQGEAPLPERDPHLTVGALVDKAAESGFGFLIGVLSLIAIPFVGLSTPFGLAIALLGGQLLIGRREPWLPDRARRRALAMTMLDRVLTLLARRTRWLARMSRRRWELAIQPRLIGLAIFVLAVALALPLPIPGSNLVFLIPLFIYSVGILERDGAWILVGHLATLIDIGLLFLFGETVIRVLERIWHWVA